MMQYEKNKSFNDETLSIYIIDFEIRTNRFLSYNPLAGKPSHSHFLQEKIMFQKEKINIILFCVKRTMDNFSAKGQLKN